MPNPNSLTLDCRRGETIGTTASSQATLIGLAWRSTDSAAVLTKARVRELHVAGDLPDPHDLLLVKMRPGAAEDWTLTLRLQFAHKPSEERQYAFARDPGKLNEEGVFSAAFVFCHGAEPLEPSLRFPVAQVVDVTEGAGHAPTVDVIALGAGPVPIRLGDAPPPVEPPPEKVLTCVCIPGLTFEFDQSFIRPSVAEKMQEIDAALTKFPDGRLFVVGHTDRVGNEQYNKDLSDRRAESTFAFITDDADRWERLYNEEGWGLKVVQTILKDLGHDPGVIDGLIGPNTRGAMRSFLGVPEGTPVENDAAFRKQLFLAYMTGKHDVKATADQFMEPKFTGCGEFNPVAAPNAAELANQAPGNEPNRRVVVYVFREDEPLVPCKLQDMAPCKAELAKPKEHGCFDCAFYDSIATLCNCECAELPPERKKKKKKTSAGTATLVVFVTQDGTPVDGATVKAFGLMDPPPEGETANGSVRLEGLVPGTFVVNAAKLARFGVGKTTLAAGDTKELTIKLGVTPPPPPTHDFGTLAVSVRKNGRPHEIKVSVASETDKSKNQSQTSLGGFAGFTLDPGDYMVIAKLTPFGQPVKITAGKQVFITFGDGHEPIPPGHGFPPSDVPWTFYFNSSFQVCHNSYLMQKLALEILKSGTSFPGGAGNKIHDIIKKLAETLAKNPEFKLPPTKVFVANCMRQRVRETVKVNHSEADSLQTNDRFEIWRKSGDGVDFRDLPEK